MAEENKTQVAATTENKDGQKTKNFHGKKNFFHGRNHRRPDNRKDRQKEHGKPDGTDNDTVKQAQTAENENESRRAKLAVRGGNEQRGENAKNGEAVKDTAPESTEKVEVIGVRFKETGKIYYFSPAGNKVAKNSFVIVETARGMEFGTAVMSNSFVPASLIVQPLKPIIRIATADDVRRHENNTRLEKESLTICAKKIAEHKLDMCLVDAEYTFDNNKLVFYFTADGRVDFRELVKDLATTFKTRIELKQIGIRDESKMLGGLGICGRPFCCGTFLSDFMQVSIKMAKNQSLSLNSAKISGACGRLICCLKYENEMYEEEIKKTPPVDSIVKCADGEEGEVVDINPLAGLIRVKLNNKPELTYKVYDRNDCEVIGKVKKADNNKQKAD